MFGFFFTDEPVSNFDDAKKSDTAKFGRFHRGMLERGIYLAPSAYEVRVCMCKVGIDAKCMYSWACLLHVSEY